MFVLELLVFVSLIIKISPMISIALVYVWLLFLISSERRKENENTSPQSISVGAGKCSLIETDVKHGKRLAHF